MWVGGVVNKKKKNEGGGVAVRSCNQPSPASIWAQTVFLTRCIVGRISNRLSGLAEILPRTLKDYYKQQVCLLLPKLGQWVIRHQEKAGKDRR